ncbi:MAG: HAMP domain-containing sensor histidine kinase [Acidimicrobiales bacterium]
MKTRRQRLGLRGRFIAAFAGAGLLLTVVLSLLTYELTRSYLTGQRERSATRQAFANARLATSVLDADDSDPRKLLDSLPAVADSRVLINVRGTWFSSDLGLSEVSLPPDFVEVVAGGNAASQRFRLNGVTQLVIGTPLGSTGSSYYEVFPLRELNQTLTALATSLAVASLVTTVLGAAAGWYASRRVLVPLQRVSSASERIAGGALGTRLRAAGDIDLQPLVDSFNAMADALQSRIEKEARFASDVSHELRTPLTALATAVQVLQSRADEMPGRVRAALDVLESQIQYFERLVLDLLEISRYDAGVNELANEEVEPVSFLREILTPLDSASLRVTTPMPLSVSIDKRRVERILANLVENAQVHAGGVEAVELGAADGVLRISVLDQGPGIAAEDRAFVFERFRRGTTSATNSVKGTGLGLALVAEHARLHGGSVEVQAGDPSGCRFTVSLPIGDMTCA